MDGAAAREWLYVGRLQQRRLGIEDLVAQVGTTYLEPDNIWVARWNGSESTVDPNVPASEWVSHRLHQYAGAHNETYGGVTINVDSDYLDGATAAAAPVVQPPVNLAIAPTPAGPLNLYPSWPGGAAVSSWQVMAGPAPTALAPQGAPIPAGSSAPIVSVSAYPYFAVEALGSTGYALESSQPVATPAHLAVFGEDVFVPAHGLIGVPVACFAVTPCEVATTVTAGRTQLSSTGGEAIGGGGGLAYFTLSSAARAAIARAKNHELAATVSIRAPGGYSTSRALDLIPFTTSGQTPRHSVRQSASIRIIGMNDFVSNGWVGGILVACVATTPCDATTSLVVAGHTITKRRAAQVLGVGEVGDLFFTLTPAGHRLLEQTRTNQLPVSAVISAGGTTASAQLTLTAF